VGIHYSDYPTNSPENARAVWEIWINGSKNSGTETGDREEIVEKWRRHIDWRLAGMPNIFG
jgi:hypothetical protein